MTLHFVYTYLGIHSYSTCVFVVMVMQDCADLLLDLFGMCVHILWYNSLYMCIVC